MAFEVVSVVTLTMFVDGVTGEIFSENVDCFNEPVAFEVVSVVTLTMFVDGVTGEIFPENVDCFNESVAFLVEVGASVTVN